MGWVPAPRQFPAKCFLTGLSSREHGPYYEVDAARPYIDPTTRKEGRMYWSFASWRTSVVDPDGPYGIVVEEAVRARTFELQERIAYLEAQLAADPAHQFANRVENYLIERARADQAVQVPERPPDTPQDPRAERSEQRPKKVVRK